MTFGKMAFDKMTIQQNDYTTKWLYDKMTKWLLAKWHSTKWHAAHEKRYNDDDGKW